MATIVLLTVISLLSPAVSMERQRLRRHQPQLENIEQEVGIASYEKGIPVEAARSLIKYATERGGGGEQMTSVVSRMPLSPDLYFVVWQPQEGDRTMFFVLRKRGEEISEVGRSQAEMSCMMVEPTFFTGSDRVLVVVSLTAGDGGFCGNYPFEFKSGTLRPLGEINVYDGVHGRGAYMGHSPMEQATVEFRDNSYFVTMRGRGSLYDEKDKRLTRPGAPFTYYLDGKTFRPSPVGRPRARRPED